MSICWNWVDDAYEWFPHDFVFYYVSNKGNEISDSQNTRDLLCMCDGLSLGVVSLRNMILFIT